MSDARVIGIISIKGGTGKTSAVCSLGAALASEFGKKVLVVDASFSEPNLALYLGMVNINKSIYNVMKDNMPAKEAIHEYQQNMHVLPASVRVRKIEPYKLRKVLDKLRNEFDIILIDSSPNLGDEMLATIVASDELFVITSPDHPTLSSTMHAVKVAKKQHRKITGLILNKVRHRKFELDVKDIEDATGLPILSVLPDDVKMLEAVAMAKPVITNSPLSNIAVEYKKLAACILGEQYKDPRLFSRIRDIFTSNIAKDEINRAVLSKTEKDRDI